MNARIDCFSLLILCMMSCWAHANESASHTVIWKNSPIKVPIKIGAEKQVHFVSDNVRIWQPTSLQHSVNIMTENGVVFIRPMNAIPTTRIKVHDIKTNVVYLLDILTSNDADDRSIHVVLEKSVVNDAIEIEKRYDYRIELVRYALQDTLGIPRIKENNPGINTASILSKSDYIRTSGIHETPIAAYQSSRYRADVIELSNTQSYRQELNIKNDIRGRWVARHLHHSQLNPINRQGDKTLLVLISDRIGG